MSKVADEILKEAGYIREGDEGRAINDAMDKLSASMKKAKNPENWAETYKRSLPGAIDMMERLTKIFNKMK